MNAEKNSQTGIAVTIEDLISMQAYANSHALPQRKKASAMLSGDRHTKRFGRGMDFAEFRHYQAGDDVRTIDWRVTARSGKTHIRVYQEERERPIWIITDQSQSMQFGTRQQFKAVLAAKIAAILAWSALKNGDRVGGFSIGKTSASPAPLRAGKHGVLHLLRSLSTEAPTANVNWSETLETLRQQVKPGSTICLISDFQDFNLAAEQSLQRLSLQQDMLIVFVSDPLEEKLPVTGIYRFTDGDQDLLLNTENNKLLTTYQQQFADRFKQIKTLCAQYNMRFIAASTAQAIADLFVKGAP